jgi:pimeloyl-ACP methyl ester carboxylesterase
MYFNREPNSLDDVEMSKSGYFLDVNGKRVHVVEQGSGPTIIFIHGLGFSTYMWEHDYFPLFSKNHHVLAIDLFGFGFSDRLIGENYGFDLWEKQILAVIDLLEIEKAVLVGHSMGGAICSLLAANYPERFSKLVILAGLTPQVGREASFILNILRIPYMGAFLLNLLKTIPPVNPFDSNFSLISNRTSSIRGSREAILSYLRNKTNFRQLSKAYSRIGIPTLIMHSQYDKVNAASGMDRAAKNISGCHYIKYGSEGHRVRNHFLNPGVIANDLVLFISEHR